MALETLARFDLACLQKDLAMQKASPRGRKNFSFTET
jgi:hypothetical protein